MDGIRQDEQSDDLVNTRPSAASQRASGAGTANPRELIAVALKRERLRTGWSIGELSRRSGVAKSTLSQLESGEGNPSMETLWAISVALGIQFSALLDVPVRAVEVIRFGEGPAIAADAADYTATLLSAASPGSRRDIYLLSSEPGKPRISAPHGRGVVEHLVMSTGRARVGPSDAPVELGPGDYISYPGDREHVFAALEPGTVAVLTIEAL